jgi:hypothetical protein
VGFLCDEISLTLDELKYAIKTRSLDDSLCALSPSKKLASWKKVARLVITTAHLNVQPALLVRQSIGSGKKTRVLSLTTNISEAEFVEDKIGYLRGERKSVNITCKEG